MDTLLNKLVMVHPQLHIDPINAQGEIGRIDYIKYNDDEVYVAFNDLRYGIYETDALLIIKPSDMLLSDIKAGMDTRERADTLKLLEIFLLQQSRKPEMIREAYGLAFYNQEVQDNALLKVQQWIDKGLIDTCDVSQDKSLPIGR